MELIIRSSAIHAAGCYTTSPIKAGTRVLEYTGPRITKEEGDRLYENSPVTYLFGLEDGQTVIDGHGMAMFINHSCEPNCETTEEDGRVWIFATRDIEAGEELTYDYLLYDGDDDAPCYCGAASCRGTMYSLQEIRKKKKTMVQNNAKRQRKRDRLNNGAQSKRKKKITS